MAGRVLITGCSSGIGRALAIELAGRGYHVTATARQIESLEGLSVAKCLSLDVTNDESVGRAVAAAGEIDVLVNNAGIGFWGPVEAASSAAVKALFETNVFGALRTIRAVLPQMRRRRSGAVLQVSSAAARRSNALLGHYAASKAALEAYSEALRIELAPFGISVSIIVLGAVETDFGSNRKHVAAPAYAELAGKVAQRIQASRRNPARAETVACTIADTLDRGALPLRLEATEDAGPLVAQRQKLSDEEWETTTLEALAAVGVDSVMTRESEYDD